MFGMSRLKSGDEIPEFGFVKPLGDETAQSPGPLRRMEMVGTMKRMARERRCALAGDHQHIAAPRRLGVTQEAEKMNPRHLDSCAVEVEAALDVHLAARQFLRGAAVKAGDLGRRLVHR